MVWYCTNLNDVLYLCDVLVMFFFFSFVVYKLMVIVQKLYFDQNPYLYACDNARVAHISNKSCIYKQLIKLSNALSTYTQSQMESDLSTDPVIKHLL